MPARISAARACQASQAGGRLYRDDRRGKVGVGVAASKRHGSQEKDQDLRAHLPTREQVPCLPCPPAAPAAAAGTGLAPTPGDGAEVLLG
jgi:hypothetical protein